MDCTTMAFQVVFGGVAFVLLATPMVRHARRTRCQNTNEASLAMPQRVGLADHNGKEDDAQPAAAPHSSDRAKRADRSVEACEFLRRIMAAARAGNAEVVLRHMRDAREDLQEFVAADVNMDNLSMGSARTISTIPGGKRRSVLVTGGSKGLGAAISKRLALEGYVVTVCDTDRAAGERLAAAVGGSFCATDVTKPDEVQRAVAHVVKTVGSLDAVVNNAGIVSPHFTSIADVDLEEWNRVVDVNLNGAFFTLKFSLAQMAKQHSGGSIVNTCSILGFRCQPGCSAYSATKFALRGLTHSAAVEYGDKNIRVNGVAPAFVTHAMSGETSFFTDDTWRRMSAMNILPGMPEPLDIAAAVAFLLSDDARYITGHTLPVDAGSLSRFANKRQNLPRADVATS